jgi:circadian clock protein KaiC
VKAKRVVLDTLETLFSGLQNEAILRSELQRLFRWLKSKGLTTVITGERGKGQLTRQGLEEYVSDCVVLLDNRVVGQVSTRRVRIVKYRGSVHGTNEYPFLIDENGISVLPITGASMDYPVSNERFSTGVAGLDEMLGGKGPYRGSATLISGTAGTGKTSLALHLAEAACNRGEKCAYFSFEESPQQLVRNARSIGIHLQKHVDKGLLSFQSARPTTHGLEMHLVRMHKLVDTFNPSMVILDPVSNLQAAGTLDDSAAILVRLMDHLRKNGVTCVFTSLVGGGRAQEATDEGLSSLVDTWLLARGVEVAGERNRVLYVLKARGMAHSNQLREFLITAKGVRLVPAYLGQGGVLTGSARAAQEAGERLEMQRAKEEMERQRIAFEHRRAALESQIANLRAGLAAEEQEYKRLHAVHEEKARRTELDREAMSRSRSKGISNKSKS